MESKEQRSFRLLLDEFYMTPKHWEDYITLKQAIDDLELYKKALDKAINVGNFDDYLDIKAKDMTPDCDECNEYEYCGDCDKCVKEQILNDVESEKQ